MKNEYGKEAIAIALKHKEDISQKIISAIKNLPRLLLESLGITETSSPLGPWLLRAE